jgi:hypothetical protein
MIGEKPRAGRAPLEKWNAISIATTQEEMGRPRNLVNPIPGSVQEQAVAEDNTGFLGLADPLISRFYRS